MQCADKFNEYHCHSKDQLSPLVQTYCTQLEQCLQRSMTGQQTKIAVGVYGEIINAFIEPLTLKSMVNCRLSTVNSFHLIKYMS
ncbi:hypothetical protein BCR43DRAFT_496649 [Syncephalastrum racemosum]|uniref:Brl1/Brr6 domain-containing protein n=1 Tax=Syncephalastrum racemosum TaxID=13706 RepID=A0A1X2H4H2_SYNRA|nr:hypothetical protein BCR43DRAFT_496649 [Syncephalastrum racemosum]